MKPKQLLLTWFITLLISSFFAPVCVAVNTLPSDELAYTFWFYVISLAISAILSLPYLLTMLAALWRTTQGSDLQRLLLRSIQWFSSVLAVALCVFFWREIGSYMNCLFLGSASMAAITGSVLLEYKFHKNKEKPELKSS